jgi:hypothetical protein
MSDDVIELMLSLFMAGNMASSPEYFKYHSFCQGNAGRIHNYV